MSRRRPSTTAPLAGQASSHTSRLASSMGLIDRSEGAGAMPTRLRAGRPTTLASSRASLAANGGVVEKKPVRRRKPSDASIFVTGLALRAHGTAWPPACLVDDDDDHARNRTDACAGSFDSPTVIDMPAGWFIGDRIPDSEEIMDACRQRPGNAARSTAKLHDNARPHQCFLHFPIGLVGAVIHRIPLQPRLKPVASSGFQKFLLTEARERTWFPPTRHTQSGQARPP
ncbi:hypothetical protein BCR34DRAFT_582641 [Clohesyomyces aquaticus]|uniref:Uncharacterized protein n=1 Tax=Clohesyomyces aquaticus TaxID=1231657 RepID=A0A1Y2A8R7_9PLEO|nr:hypothetical protein BCR34DRAFT_582641 [Clohesyomyces aquaticus]